MVWPLQKLDVINAALIEIGTDPIAVNDGSDSWTAGSTAYEIALEYALDNHNWAAITKFATLNPSTVPPQDNQFDTAYERPPDCVHILLVRLNDFPVDYKITGNRLEIRAIGGSSLQNPPPVGAVPGVVTMKYVSSDPAGDASPATDKLARTFFVALIFFTMSGIYRSLKDDLAESANFWKLGVETLQGAKTRADQEQPKRTIFNSRLYAARRIRRPWPFIPVGWGGTGTPG